MFLTLYFYFFDIDIFDIFGKGMNLDPKRGSRCFLSGMIEEGV